MKAILYDKNGKKKAEMVSPAIFDTKIREDIASKYFEADKIGQPYTNSPLGGRKHSAAGTISHKRHDWKGHYGKGISRIPRKIIWRRGTQFNWIGAEISGTRGGRRVHGPKGIGKEKKINRKEIKIAMSSGFAASANEKYITQRYSSIDKVKFSPLSVIESDLDKIKTKDFLEILKNIFGEAFSLVLKNKRVRAGKGKARGRKYKSNAGLMLIKSKDEKIKISGIDIRSVEEVSISDLYPLGRIAVYTEKALKEIENYGDKK